MKDYVKIIAENLEHGLPVVIYTVGGDTFSVLRQLRHRFGLLPTAICDGDPAKQGRAYKGLFGVPVLSPEAAIAKYPNALFFISSMDYRYQIMGQLTSIGKLAAERIINWEPVVRRKSCTFFERSIFLRDDGSLIFCCVPNSPSSPYDRDYNKFAKGFMELRDSLIAGSSNDSLPGPCSACPYALEEWYPENPKSWWINYFNRSACNFKCAYCGSPTHTKKEAEGVLELGKTISAFRAVGMLSDFYSVVLSTSGEPTLHPKRQDFYSSFDGYALNINTNGSLFDKGLFALMQEKNVRLVVSIDSGTRETFKKIKGVDLFDKVKDNLKQYQSAAVGLVAPKYIVVPSLNDNEADADGFASFVNDINAPYAIVAYDQNGERPIPESAAQFIRRIKRVVEACDILCVPYTPYETPDYVFALQAALEVENEHLH